MRAWIIRKIEQDTERQDSNGADAPDYVIFTKSDLSRNVAPLYLTEDAADRAVGWIKGEFERYPRYTHLLGYEKFEIEIPD